MMETFDDVFDALAESPAEAANMKARADLLSGIRSRVAGWGLPHDRAAKRLSISKSRLDDLVRGQVDAFSLDDLVAIATVADLLPASRTIDAATRRAADAFLIRVREIHGQVEAWLFGSRARGTHAEDSDADIAVILQGRPTNRFAAIGPLADAAYDVLMETGIHIQPLPLWDSELERPDVFGNPALIESIKREGIRL